MMVSFNIGFLLTDQRGARAAMRLLTKAVHRHPVPETITIDGSKGHCGDHRHLERRARRHDRSPLGALLQRYRGAGSSCRVTCCPPDAGMHVGGSVPAHHGRHRSDAHDQERIVGRGRGSAGSDTRSIVLPPGSLIPSSSRFLMSSLKKFATHPSARCIALRMVLRIEHCTVWGAFAGCCSASSPSGPPAILWASAHPLDPMVAHPTRLPPEGSMIGDKAAGWHRSCLEMP
jgi:hypothetical protein